MSKSHRTKGHSWERRIANDLKPIDPSAKRLLEYQEGMGIDIDTKLPLRIQCKSSFQASKGLTGLAEAGEEAGKLSVCALKVTQKGEFAILHWADFLDLYKSYWELSNK